ncbi:MAG: DoxX family protein, partial [Stenotrophomonas lactitubi]|uniref:DoxX family protein n=2 Tax=Stenotrophomonas TaxID=40323 RepID=UPI003D0DE8C9
MNATATPLSPLAAYAATLLRLALGVLFLVHALTKLLVFTPAGTAAFFESLGLPGVLGYLTIAVELTISAALLLGIYARWIGLLGVPLLLGTIVTV